ncbi:MAG TPA: ABC transporter ATP-binding protein [Anaerolineaceae bacterium]|nr:ABC transporter ATP-binding protein [Anaerolineaceae bacterium]
MTKQNPSLPVKEITPPKGVLSDDLPTKGFDPVVTRNLFGFMRPYTVQIILSLLLMLLNSAAAVAGPYLVKVGLDSGLAAGSFEVLRTTILLYILISVVQWASIYGRVYIMARVGQSIIFDLRARLFSRLQELSLSFFSRYSVGRIITRVINDVNVLREFILWAMLAIVRDLFTLIGILVTMLVMDPSLSLLTFTVLPLMAIATNIFRKRARENYRKTRAAMSWVNSVLAENINGVRVVQSFSREDTNYAFFSGEVNQHNLETNLKSVRLASIFFPTIDFLGSLAMALVIWLGGTAVLGEQITPGVLVAFVLYINRFFEPIRDLSQRFDTFQSTMASGERVLALLSAPIEVQDAPQAVEMPPIRGEVQFEKVNFHYLDDDTPVLTDITLHIQSGETVALVGKTGAGKTTLIKLLARFNDPTEGKVLVDGYDLRQVTQHSLRRQMGIVLQDPFLFSGSVRENIRFGRLEASDAEIESAARAVGAHEFISELPHAYETPVEEGGMILSVGQRQLISFARALLANPRILILDEATSSVDTQTERIIQNALARLLKDRTAFVIAHRLSTVVNASHIIVVQDGRIIEQGTHNQLLALQGEYYKLYSLRFEEE